MGKRMRRAAALIAVALLFQAVVPGALAKRKSPKPKASVASALVDIPVSFDVVNKNESGFSCPSDGLDYTVHGHLTGPQDSLDGPVDKPRLVSLLLTGFDEGEWTWRFRELPGRDYVGEMAKLGHISVSIDMLGFGASGEPHGQLACWGSQADVAHQIVQHLRNGTYTVPEGTGAPEFSTVLLHGRDSGTLAAVIEAYSWNDIDGVSGAILAHQGASQYIITFLARRTADCLRGGMDRDDPPDDPDDPLDDPSRGGGYIYFGPRNEEFRTDLFSEDRADPAVIDAVIGLRNRNPCGHVTSVSAAIRRNLVSMKDIDIPVLLVYPGPDDPVFTRSGQEAEAANYSGSDDVTTVWLDSGHFMELEGCAPDFRAFTSEWIRARWGVGQDVPDPPVGPDECVTEVRVKE